MLGIPADQFLLTQFCYLYYRNYRLLRLVRGLHLHGAKNSQLMSRLIQMHVLTTFITVHAGVQGLSPGPCRVLSLDRRHDACYAFACTFRRQLWRSLSPV